MQRFFAPGWRSTLFALFAFLVLPDFPSALRSFVPVTETWVLFAAALAVCAALGWWNGGGAWLAVLAMLLGWYVAMAPVGVGAGTYRSLVHGWTLLLAAGFGVASLMTPGQGFFRRALAAVGIAAVGAFAVTVATPDGVATVRSAVRGELVRRTEETVAVVNQMAASPMWKNAAARNPGLDSMVATNEADLRSLGDKAARTAPALVALESLLALTLGWVLYHRLSGAALGPRLGKVREFRFNDQLVWGLAVGATIFFLPVFAEGKDAGLNLLVFFGALYLLRGIGVLSFMTRSRWAGTLLIVMTIFAPLLLGAVALGVGVGDTWMDWRARVQANA
ncbi:MAG: YybS family protein [Gemmatimonadota bacterium]|nr:YybS family protein [Gemmatimonadota bacterium]